MLRRFDDPEDRITLERYFEAGMRLMNQPATNYGWDLDGARQAFESGPYRIVEEIRAARGRPAYARYTVERVEMVSARGQTRAVATGLSWAPTPEEAVKNLIVRIVRDALDEVFAAVSGLLTAAQEDEGGDEDGQRAA